MTWDCKYIVQADMVNGCLRLEGDLTLDALAIEALRASHLDGLTCLADCILIQLHDYFGFLYYRLGHK